MPAGGRIPPVSASMHFPGTLVQGLKWCAAPHYPGISTFFKCISRVSAVSGFRAQGGAQPHIIPALVHFPSASKRPSDGYCLYDDAEHPTPEAYAGGVHPVLPMDTVGGGRIPGSYDQRRRPTATSETAKGGRPGRSPISLST